MKFLIAGFGSIGRRHFRNLLELGERDILIYRTGRSTLPEDELSGYIVETDLQAALAHKPDAVIVANPTALHLDVARAAAEEGCHILFEKPISHTMEGLPAFAALCKEKNIRVLVGFQFRFHPALKQIKLLLDQQAIGKTVSARAHWGEYLPGWHPWEDYRASYSANKALGGGVILTLCHPFDYLRMLFGEASSLWCFTGTGGELMMDVEDTAEVGLRFGSSMLATIHLDYIQRPAKHDLEIIGTQGTIYWDAADNTVHLFQAETGMIEAYPPAPDFERNHLFLDEMRHFIQVAIGEESPLCSLEDGIQALELALGALASAESGRIVHFKS